jgi:trk system potassium uptake protein TrkH
MSKYDAMRFAVRPMTVARLLADMFGLLALLTAVPAGLALATGAAAWPAYSAVVTMMTLLWLGGRLLPEPHRVQKNEALVMVALLFTCASLLLSLPMMSYGVPFIDAWFEAVSGVTTTGLSTLSLQETPAAFLFGRAWMQWVGGIGVVVLALAIFVRPGAIASRLGFNDTEMDDVVGGTRAHARRVILIYLLLTVLGSAALYFSGASLLDAVVHCMAALSTGGFANYGDSLASVGAAQLWLINLLCLAGAISFHLYYRALLYTGRGRVLDSQFYALLTVIAAATCLAWLLLSAAGSDLALSDILTLVIGAQTTAGYSTVAVGTLPPTVLLLLTLCMAIGGGVGSTAGGIKLERVWLLLRIAYRALLRSGLPDAVYVHGERPAAGSRVEEAVALVLWFLVILLVSWLVFLGYGYPPLKALFEVTSALSNVGLSSGLTAADLPTELKILLCFNMLSGRVEIIALLVLFAPRSWIGRRRASRENSL